MAFSVSSWLELRSALSVRQGSRASFWLNEGAGEVLAIAVNGERACIHYFPRVGHPGFFAIGPVPDCGRHVEFVADNYEPMDVPVAMVVHWGAALQAAEEFFVRTAELPASLAWEEL